MPNYVFHLFALLTSLLCLTCHAPPADARLATADVSTACIERILVLDDSFGTVRNHSSESTSLSAGVRNYIRSLRELDYEGCPEAFTEAYAAHREAWEGVLPITDRHLNLRGEMHDLFARLEKSSDSILFRQRVAAIWSTWDQVEQAVPGDTLE